jgi:phospholipid/cholesterol/gamma-HCH transport system substrate-binding protein
MDERIVRFRVGVMVLATLLITGILVLLFGEVPSLVQETYTIRMKFSDAPGITQSTPIRKSGILIGRVTEVDFAEDGDVVVTAAIDANRQLTHNEVPRIRSSLLGDTMVQFVPAEDETLPRDPIKPGETVQGAVVADPLQVVRDLQPALNEMMRSVTRTSNELGQLTRQINGLLENNDQQLGRVLAKTERTLDSIYQTMQSADQVLGDPELRADLKRSLKDIPEVIAETREAMAGFQGTLELADRNLRNLEGFTRPLGERGDAIFEKLDSGAGKLELLMERLIVFSDALNNPEGSLGRLTRDPQLYTNILEATENINCLTRDLRPILDDVRVFTDKVARDPGRLGVRGVFQKNSGLK